MHSALFSAADPHIQDTRDLLSAERRKVLAGCTIVFSGVFPRLAVPQDDFHWQFAEKVCGSHC